MAVQRHRAKGGDVVIKNCVVADDLGELEPRRVRPASIDVDVEHVDEKGASRAI